MFMNIKDDKLLANKSKLTLLVDGNWLLMSRLYVINNKYSDEDELILNLKSLMTHSISVVLRRFQDIDNIIVVSDGGSWRNSIEVPSFLKMNDIIYKGNRTKSTNIDWTLVFNAYDEWLNDLSEANITVCKEESIEGDDWVWYWSKKLNKENTNVIIWSKDRDLTQLVNTNSNSCFTIWWNATNGIYYDQVKDEELDLLLNPYFNNNEQLLHKLLNISKENKIINKNKVILDKIIRGDLGDNIQPIIYKKPKSSTSTKKFRIPEKEIDYDNINIYDDQSIRNWLDNLYINKGYSIKTDKNIEDAYEHFIYNRKLVVLDKTIYPEYILEKFNNYSSYKCNKNILILESKYKAEQNNIQSILDII